MPAYKANADTLTEDEIRSILSGLEKYLRDPTVECEIRINRGMKESPNYDTGVMDITPTIGQTIAILIKIHGGAKHIVEDPISAALA